MRDTSWQDEVRPRLEDFIDIFVVRGAKAEDVCNAIAAELGNVRAAYAVDPDPADDAPPRDPEPSNDWPGA